MKCLFFSQNQNRTRLRVVFTGGTFFYFSSQFLFSLLLLSERRNDSVTRSRQCASGLADSSVIAADRQYCTPWRRWREEGGRGDGRGVVDEDGGRRLLLLPRRKVPNPPRRVRVRVATPGGCYHMRRRWSRCGPRHQQGMRTHNLLGLITPPIVKVTFTKWKTPISRKLPPHLGSLWEKNDISQNYDGLV